MEKKFKQHFSTTHRRLTKKIMAFVNWSTFLVHFTMLAPYYIQNCENNCRVTVVEVL